MADENEQQLTDAIMGEGGDQAGADGGAMIWVVLVVVVVIGAGGGFLTGRMINATPAQAEADEPRPDRPEAADAGKVEGELAFFHFEPITANLNEERLRRFIRAKISLAIRKESMSQAESVLNRRIDELTSWLNIYLSGCTLDDVRGPKNLRRIQREIRELLNDRLWPDQKPLIEKVLLNEWHVQ
ncbi:MAG: flagellar basal body-associated FliL family protein [Planctomycetota bacterium]|jgi:flagellar basal body-associated protein FliL